MKSIIIAIFLIIPARSFGLTLFNGTIRYDGHYVLLKDGKPKIANGKIVLCEIWRGLDGVSTLDIHMGSIDYSAVSQENCLLEAK